MTRFNPARCLNLRTESNGSAQSLTLITIRKCLTLIAPPEATFLGLELKSDHSEYAKRDMMAMFPHWLDESGNVTADFSDGVGTESDAFNTTMENSMIFVLLPHVQEFRHIARLLTVDSRRAVEENDSVRVVENVKTMFAVGQHASESPILVCSLVAMAINDLAFQVIEETISEHPGFLSENELTELQETIANLQIRELVKLDGERAMMYDILQRVYTDDGNGDGRMTMIGAESIDMLIRAWGNAYSEPNSGLGIVYDKIASPTAVFTMAITKRNETDVRRVDGSSGTGL